MEEPQAGRRGCSVKTMNEQRLCAGLLRVAAPLWAELKEARPFAPGRQGWDQLPVLSAPTPEQMLRRINSSFNVKTQKYPVPSSLPPPPAASSRSFPWHRRKLQKGCNQLENLLCDRRDSLVVAPDGFLGGLGGSFVLSRASGLHRGHLCPLLHGVEARKK